MAEDGLISDCCHIIGLQVSHAGGFQQIECDLNWMAVEKGGFVSYRNCGWKETQPQLVAVGEAPTPTCPLHHTW